MKATKHNRTYQRIAKMYLVLSMMVLNTIWVGGVLAQQHRCELSPQQGIEPTSILANDAEDLPFPVTRLYDDAKGFEEATDTLINKISKTRNIDVSKDGFWVWVRAEQISIEYIVLQINDPTREPAFLPYPHYRSQDRSTLCVAIKFDTTSLYDKTFRLCAKLQGMSEKILLSRDMPCLKNTLFRFAINPLPSPSNGYWIERKIFNLGRKGYAELKGEYDSLRKSIADSIGVLNGKIDTLEQDTTRLGKDVRDLQNQVVALKKQEPKWHDIIPPAILMGMALWGGNELINADGNYKEYLSYPDSSILYKKYENQRRRGSGLVVTSALAATTWLGSDWIMRAMKKKPKWWYKWVVAGAAVGGYVALELVDP